jgi:hypothetical protein
MNWKKINIKTTFKSVLENIFQKNMNFGKYFSKTIWGQKWNFKGVGRNKEGGSYIIQLYKNKMF